MTSATDQANQRAKDLVKHLAKLRTGDKAAPCAYDAAATPPAANLSSDASLGASAFARQARLAYGLLQNTIEEATESVELSNAQITAEVEDLQSKALRSLQQSALATIELFEAMGAAETPGDFASRQMALA